MTLEEAYTRLGLTPLSLHMKLQIGENRRTWPGSILPLDLNQQPKEIFRQMGATTWMCVRAAMALEKESVLIVGCYGPHQVMEMVNRVALFAERLGITTSSHAYRDRIEMDNGAEIRWTTTSPGQKIVGARGHRGPVFSDWEWAERMERRAKGPFAMIREIRAIRSSTNGEVVCLYAFAEESEFLMELTPEGAEELAANQTVRCVGWTPRHKTRNDILLSR